MTRLVWLTAFFAAGGRAVACRRVAAPPPYTEVIRDMMPADRTELPGGLT